MIKSLVANGAAVLTARNPQFETALQVAGCWDGHTTAKHRIAVRRCLFAADPRLRTLVLQHPECLLHVTEEAHQEAPARIHAILRKLRTPKLFPPYELDISDAFERASEQAVGRAHTRQYISFLNTLAKQVSDSGDKGPVPFTPQVQKLVQLQSEAEIKDADKSDTTFSNGSLGAALRAAGSVIHAIDAVLGGANQTHRNAFCCVRPPGHHAGANGLEESAVSCGFCIFNNVAIGALHALAIGDSDGHNGLRRSSMDDNYPPLGQLPQLQLVSASSEVANGSSATAAASPAAGAAAAAAAPAAEAKAKCDRVAVIDFDVHHGNGTQVSGFVANLLYLSRTVKRTLHYVVIARQSSRS